MHGIRLKRLTLSGYKSFAGPVVFEPGPVTVLVGGNGAGKSNLLGFLRLLTRMLTGSGELRAAVLEEGGASAMLHDGPKVTQEIHAEVELERHSQVPSGGGEQEPEDPTHFAYSLNMTNAPDDTFLLRESFAMNGSVHYSSDSPRNESALALHSTHSFLMFIRAMLWDIQVFQFQDTSMTAGIRRRSQVQDGVWLRSDGGNLAAVLLGLANGDEQERQAYQSIERTMRLVIPFFSHFVLIPEGDTLLLRWRERNSEMIFNPSKASDGMLRLFSLITLLSLPKHRIPGVICIDEIELGLHPAALNLVAALVRTAALESQVILATQSATLLDEFTLDEVVVASRRGRATELLRPSPAEYASWLEEYSTGDLWATNVIGGGPGS